MAPEDKEEVLVPNEPTQHVHRGVDTDGNPDDLLSEEEALDNAREDGIEFVDVWYVEGDEDTTFTTKKAASKAAKGKNVIQKRSQK